MCFNQTIVLLISVHGTLVTAGLYVLLHYKPVAIKLDLSVGNISRDLHSSIIIEGSTGKEDRVGKELYWVNARSFNEKAITVTVDVPFQRLNVAEGDVHSTGFVDAIVEMRPFYSFAFVEFDWQGIIFEDSLRSK